MSVGGLIAGGVALGLFGGGIAYWFGKLDTAQKTLAEASRSWPSAPGRIVASSIEVKKSGSGKSQTVQYIPVIAYDYEARGEQHQGTRIRFGMLGFSFRGNAENVLVPYPLGRSLTVRFNPDAPGDSVLEAGVTASHLRHGVIAGWCVTALGVTLVIAGSIAGA